MNKTNNILTTSPGSHAHFISDYLREKAMIKQVQIQVFCQIKHCLLHYIMTKKINQGQKQLAKLLNTQQEEVVLKNFT